MPRLRDISGDELSLVGRGAVRPRFAFRKADDGHIEIDDATLATLTKDADGEEKLLKQLADIDAHAGLSAVAAYRLLKAHSDDLPEGHPFRKAMAAIDDCEPDYDDGDDDEEMAKTAGEADADLVAKAKYTAAQRRQMAENGEAMPDGSYPIADKEDLERAVRAVGRGRNNSHADIRAHIVKRAKQLGATDSLPDSWNVSKEDTRMADTATVPVKKEDGTWDLSGVPEEQRPTMEAFLKSLDDAREAEIEQVRKTADEEKSQLQKTADEALAIAKAERDARETAEYVAKAEQVGQGEEFGPVLKTIAGSVDEETFEKLEAVLKANHEQAKAAGLYQEIGKSGHSNGAAAGAQAQLDAKADEIRKADSSLTKEQALVKAYKENPDLYAQLREEER